MKNFKFLRKTHFRQKLYYSRFLKANSSFNSKLSDNLWEGKKSK